MGRGRRRGWRVLAGLSFAIGVLILGVWGYQRGYEAGFQSAKIAPKPQAPRPQATPQTIAKTPFNPSIEKPKFYMGSIQGTLTYKHAIQIAQNYYKQGAYENAIIWAYRANQINPNDIQSWKIYTQSLAKMGQEKQANELFKQAEIFFNKR
ncbi:hypothetical protein BKH46_08090 [Helicobacter sp. 12S02634-8]|uniref:tetratricopeptide repeat protein n=1 Tax=Helicobacter sp. 12S02634-8 TaxID=1476199 RepID=UPI000BA68DD4|nr:hypothetical protein [Helicobacter sp. 12S02634-8]PAF46263.1 hypothetical protein BKH46_08090 [Helicobacter sp. 12S02634-8]